MPRALDRQHFLLRRARRRHQFLHHAVRYEQVGRAVDEERRRLHAAHGVDRRGVRERSARLLAAHVIHAAHDDGCRQVEALHLPHEHVRGARIARILDNGDKVLRHIVPPCREKCRRPSHGNAVQHDTRCRINLGDARNPCGNITAFKRPHRHIFALALARSAQIRRQDMIAVFDVRFGIIPRICLTAPVAVQQHDPAMTQCSGRKVCRRKMQSVEGAKRPILALRLRPFRQMDIGVGKTRGDDGRRQRIAAAAALQGEVNEVAVDNIDERTCRERREQKRRHDTCEDDGRQRPHFPAFMRLMALTSAIADAVMMSVSIPAPHVTLPFSAVMPMYAIAREVEPISSACSLYVRFL